jgi:hypothetical protein
VAPEKYANRLALSKTQKLLAIAEKGESPRVCIRVPAEELRRWERARKAMHLPSMTALIRHAVGVSCDRFEVK